MRVFVLSVLVLFAAASLPLQAQTSPCAESRPGTHSLDDVIAALGRMAPSDRGPLIGTTFEIWDASCESLALFGLPKEEAAPSLPLLGSDHADDVPVTFVVKGAECSLFDDVDFAVGGYDLYEAEVLDVPVVGPQEHFHGLPLPGRLSPATAPAPTTPAPFSPQFEDGTAPDPSGRIADPPVPTAFGDGRYVAPELRIGDREPFRGVTPAESIEFQFRPGVSIRF